MQAAAANTVVACFLKLCWPFLRFEVDGTAVRPSYALSSQALVQQPAVQTPNAVSKHVSGGEGGPRQPGCLGFDEGFDDLIIVRFGEVRGGVSRPWFDDLAAADLPGLKRPGLK